MKDVNNNPLICTDKTGNIVPGDINGVGIWMYETKIGPTGRLTRPRPIIIIPDDANELERLKREIKDGYPKL